MRWRPILILLLLATSSAWARDNIDEEAAITPAAAAKDVIAAVEADDTSALRSLALRDEPAKGRQTESLVVVPEACLRPADVVQQRKGDGDHQSQSNSAGQHCRCPSTG